MGRNSGSAYSGAANGGTVAVNSNGKKLTPKQVGTMMGSSESLGGMKNKDMQKQIYRAISRYESVMGLRERTIRLADTPGAYGVTFIGSDGSHGIYLSKSHFDRPKKVVETEYKRNNYSGHRQKTNFKNVTNRAAQHTITHELAHATWTSGYTSSKHQAAGKEIKTLYKKWMKDHKKKGYGSYGRSSVDEFWAEVVTKGIHGSADRYTRKAIHIAHKYKL